jgi:hypothetical protein
MDCTLAEHRSVMKGNDFHIQYSRNLAGRGRGSLGGAGRVSTGDRGYEKNCQ